MAKRRKVTTVKTVEVPSHLRDLIPTVERWAIWNPHDCDKVLAATSTDDLTAFVGTIEANRKSIDNWLDTMPKNLDDWPAAAESFLDMVRTWHEASCELYARRNKRRSIKRRQCPEDKKSE